MRKFYKIVLVVCVKFVLLSILSVGIFLFIFFLEETHIFFNFFVENDWQNTFLRKFNEKLIWNAHVSGKIISCISQSFLNILSNETDLIGKHILIVTVQFFHRVKLVIICIKFIDNSNFVSHVLVIILERNFN